MCPDLFWDRVVSIEPAGTRKVYDLTVTPTACFIAEDIVVHNSDLLYAIGNDASASGAWVEIWYVPDLVRALWKGARTGRSAVFDAVSRCHLPGLDDLGTEAADGYRAGDWRTHLTSILDDRGNHSRRRNMVSLNGPDTDNLPAALRSAERAKAAAAFGDRYGARVVTRIQQGCVGAWIEGKCLREEATTWNPF